jgi:hypothetical protein
LRLAVLVLVILAFANLTRGQYRARLRGIRDSEAAAHALGIWVPGYKVLAFVLSAVATGLGGGLMAHQVQYLTPEAFSLDSLHAAHADGGDRRARLAARRGDGGVPDLAAADGDLAAEAAAAGGAGEPVRVRDLHLRAGAGPVRAVRAVRG